MTDALLGRSTHAYARIAGVLYLFIIVAGIFNEIFVRDGLSVSGDAAATAQNILASQSVWRISIAAGVAMLVCAVVVALVLYDLLRPVSRTLALLAVFFNLVSISIEATIKLSLVAVLFLLGSPEYSKAFEPPQLHALMNVSLRLHSSGYNISLVFFGFNCLVWGYLIVRSGYFPRILGTLLILCGVCYVANSFAWFLAPAVAAKLVPAILLPCLVAEAFLCLWLIMKGVNVPKWNERVGALRG